MTEVTFKKILEIEEAIINRLYYFAKEAESDDKISKNWSREGIAVLSKALKDITTVKVMNLGVYTGSGDEDEDDSPILTVRGIDGSIPFGG